MEVTKFWRGRTAHAKKEDVRLLHPTGNMISMDKTGLATLLVGIVLLVVGGILMWYWLPQFIQVLLGGIGIIFAVAGLVGIVLGYLMIKE